MTDEAISFLEACARLGIDIEETGYLGVADEIPGLEGGEDLVSWVAMVKRLEPVVPDSEPLAERYHVREVDDGMLFFDVVETRFPDADSRTKQLPEFVRDTVRRLLRAEAYGEWFDTLYDEAKIVDLAAEQRARALEAQRQQEQQQPLPMEE